MPNVPLLVLECLALERKPGHIKAESSYTEEASLMILGWMLPGKHNHTGQWPELNLGKSNYFPTCPDSHRATEDEFALEAIAQSDSPPAALILPSDCLC